MRQSLSKRQQSKASGKGKASVANTGARAAATKRVGATPKQVKKGVIAAAKPGKPAKSAKGAGARSGVVAKTTAAKPVRKASAPVARPAAAAKKPVEKPPVVVKTAAKAKATTSAKPKKDAVGSKTAAPSAPLQAKPKTPVRKPRPKSGHKVHLPLVVTVAAPPPPEPPRRHLSPGAIRAFEHAVKVFNRRQFEDAREMFESLKTRFPNDVEIAARSQMYIQVCVQKVAQSKAIPRNADELYDRGVFALNIGDFSQARQFFEKALRINPDAPHLLYSLAATHAQVGAHAEALEYLRRSIQIQPRFRSQAYNDADFSELRENKQFLELLGLTSPFDLLESKR